MDYDWNITRHNSNSNWLVMSDEMSRRIYIIFNFHTFFIRESQNHLNLVWLIDEFLNIYNQFTCLFEPQFCTLFEWIPKIICNFVQCWKMFLKCLSLFLMLLTWWSLRLLLFRFTQLLCSPDCLFLLLP